MIRKFREWLFRWLPYEIKEEYISAYNKLKKENARLEQENRELQAYINGVQTVLRSRAKMYIKNEVSANERQHNNA